MRRRGRSLARAPPRPPRLRGAEGGTRWDGAGAHGLGSAERAGRGRSWGGEAVSPPQVGGGDDGEGAPPEGAGAVSMTTRYPAGGDSDLSRPEPPGLGPSVRERSWWRERDQGNRVGRRGEPER